MRIVNRKEFLALPPETVFAKYNDYSFGDICIKGDTISLDSPSLGDFYYQRLCEVEADNSFHEMELLDSALNSGRSFDLDLNCIGRDGMFDVDQMFAVWEHNDLSALIDRLVISLNGG